MTINYLRKWHPDWTWGAERYGSGWRYAGRKFDKVVIVYAVAVLTGEDEYETQWRVDDGEKSETLPWWQLRHVKAGNV